LDAFLKGASKIMCKEPTIRVADKNAHTTPIANARPNVAKGGKGEIIFARNAATVVITANDNGTLSLVQARAHASAGSG
jgi:hypothetical protein